MKGAAHTEDSSRPRVWHVAAAFEIPGGIEAHVLHYATEMRNHGFDTEVVVFKPLPSDRHRFLSALTNRNIRIRSLEDLSRPWAARMAAGLLGPWFLYTLLAKRRQPNPAHFRVWVRRQASFLELKRLLARETPDVIHIFGRLHHDAWKRFPAAHTIFHEMMTGTVDSHWSEYELTAFRAFAENAARYFAPGEGVATNVEREFGIKRRINAIYTMCPDESPAEPAGTTDYRLRTTDYRLQTAERNPVSADHACCDVGAAVHGPWSVVHGPSSLRFGVLCRFTGQKGIRYLLDALKQYRDRHGGVEFTFAGSGPMEEQIRAFAAAHGMPGVRVVRVPSAPAALKNIDVFVHPSVGDAMPMAIAEALMCGIPCIVCRVGGCADLVRDGVEGLVIEPKQTAAILASMERFAVMHPEEYLDFCRRARRRYEDVCRPDQVGAVVARHYRELLAAPGATT